MIKKRVLVVADDPSEVWAISSSILKNGLEVIATTSGSDGFHQLERSSFDYLVLDSHIEEVGLFTFLSYCHRYFPGTNVIIVTDSNPSTVREIPFITEERCLPRPVNPEALCDLMSRIDANEKSRNQLNQARQEKEATCKRPN